MAGERVSISVRGETVSIHCESSDHARAVFDYIEAMIDTPLLAGEVFRPREGCRYKTRVGGVVGPLHRRRSKTYDEIRWTWGYCYWDEFGKNCGPACGENLDLLEEVPDADWETRMKRIVDTMGECQSPQDPGL